MAFTALTSIHQPELVAQWEHMDDVPRLVNGKVCSVYEAWFQDGAVYHVLYVIDISDPLSISASHSTPSLSITHGS